MREPIKVGLAAYGMSGKVFHAPLLAAHPGFRLQKIVERTNRGSGEKYPSVAVVEDFSAILQDREIELVVVNTPESTHFELTQAALNAGKHVVVEKAFTVTTQEARSLIDLAREKGSMLSVFQNSRWHGDFLTVQQVIGQKLLGQLVEFEAHYDRFRNFIQPNSWKEEPRPGVGVLHNLGSHMIDQALVLFGWPQSVWADLRIQRPGGKVVDNYEVILFYDTLKVTLKTSYLVREPGPRYTLHGTEGSFVKYGTDPQEEALKSGQIPGGAGWVRELEAYWGKLNTQLNGLHVEGRIETLPGSYLDYYGNIYGAIREQKELLVKPGQALQTIAIIEIAIKSSQERKEIVLEPWAAEEAPGTRGAEGDGLGRRAFS